MNSDRITTTKLEHKDTWAFWHLGMRIEVTNHAQEAEHYNGHGCWCYYVYIPERFCKPGEFEKLWLEDQLMRLSPECPERVTHDYLGILPDCEWHGGVTFYRKHGHTPGHRCVEIGCDYGHLRDEEREFAYDVYEVAADARHTAQLIAESVLLPVVEEGGAA